MEETLREVRNAAETSAAQKSHLSLPPQSPHDSYRPDTPGGYQSPGYSDYQPAPAPGHTPSCATPQYHDNTLNYNNHTALVTTLLDCSLMLNLLSTPLLQLQSYLRLKQMQTSMMPW